MEENFDISFKDPLEIIALFKDLLNIIASVIKICPGVIKLCKRKPHSWYRKAKPIGEFEKLDLVMAQSSTDLNQYKVQKKADS